MVTNISRKMKIYLIFSNFGQKTNQLTTSEDIFKKHTKKMCYLLKRHNDLIQKNYNSGKVALNNT